MELELLRVVELELLDESSFFEQEMTVRLKRDMRIMYKIFFIFYFNTKSKILLVIRRTQNITLIGLFYKKMGILLGWCLTVKKFEEEIFFQAEG